MLRRFTGADGNFTLKTDPHNRADLDCFKPQGRYQRMATRTEKKPEGRWCALSYAEELLQRNVFWLKDESLEDSATLAVWESGEIAHDLRTALEQFEAIQTDLARRTRP